MIAVIDRPNAMPRGSSSPTKRAIAARAPNVISSASRSGACSEPRWHSPDLIAVATASATDAGVSEPPGPSKRASPCSSAGNSWRTVATSYPVLVVMRSMVSGPPEGSCAEVVALAADSALDPSVVARRSNSTFTVSKPLCRWAWAYVVYARRSASVSETASVKGVSSARGQSRRSMTTLSSMPSMPITEARKSSAIRPSTSPNVALSDDASASTRPT